MEPKQIQEQRIRRYFIDATKKLIKGEGLESVSARNIARDAGYSYATLYNYFKDVKELVFFCVQDFQDECEVFIADKTKNAPAGLPGIAAITQAYISYFLEYPNIFELFFVEKLSEVSNNKQATDLITSFLNRLCQSKWDDCINSQVVSEEIARQKQEELQYSITGLLLFYMNRRKPETYQEFITTSERLIKGMLAL